MSMAVDREQKAESLRQLVFMIWLWDGNFLFEILINVFFRLTLVLNDALRSPLLTRTKIRLLDLQKTISRHYAGLYKHVTALNYSKKRNLSLMLGPVRLNIIFQPIGD